MYMCTYLVKKNRTYRPLSDKVLRLAPPINVNFCIYTSVYILDGGSFRGLGAGGNRPFSSYSRPWTGNKQKYFHIMNIGIGP